MTTDYRPTVLGPVPEIKPADPAKAIEKLEKDLLGSAELLRKIRAEFVAGKIEAEEYEAYEKEFAERLIQQRQILQNLHKAAAFKD